MFDLSNNVDFGLVLLAGDRRVIQFNRWLRARAQIAAEPVGGTLEAAFGMPMNLRLQAAVEHALDRGQSSRLSSALNPSPLPLYDEGKDGQRIRQAVDVSPIDLEDGRRACLLQVRDVSETHRREALFKRQAQLLEKSERRLMATLENAPSGMAMCALNGHWTYSNRAVELILGYPRSTLVGRPVESLVHPDDLAMH